MMYLLFFAAAVYVAGVAGQVPPQKCCVEKKFQASMTDLGTINSNQFEILTVAFDSTSMQQALISSTFDPRTKQSVVTARTVQDYRKQKMFTIPANEPTKCYVSPNPFAMLQCVPDDADYLGSTYLGPVSALPYDGWRFKMPNNDMVVTMAFSTQGCVPIVEGWSWGSTNKTYLFTSFQPGIKNPEWFVLPESCGQ